MINSNIHNSNFWCLLCFFACTARSKSVDGPLAGAAAGDAGPDTPGGDMELDLEPDAPFSVAPTAGGKSAHSAGTPGGKSLDFEPPPAADLDIEMDMGLDVALGEETPGVAAAAAGGVEGGEGGGMGEEDMGGGSAAGGGGGGWSTPGGTAGGFTPPSVPVALLPSPRGNLGDMDAQVETQEELNVTQTQTREGDQFQMQTQEGDQTQTQTQTQEGAEEAGEGGAKVTAAAAAAAAEGSKIKKKKKSKPLLSKKRVVVDGADAAGGGAASIEMPGEVIRALLQDREPLLNRKVGRV